MLTLYGCEAPAATKQQNEVGHEVRDEVGHEVGHEVGARGGGTRHRSSQAGLVRPGHVRQVRSSQAGQVK